MLEVVSDGWGLIAVRAEEATVATVFPTDPTDPTGEPTTPSGHVRAAMSVSLPAAGPHRRMA
ncbi:hypothetical protein [Saccharothrix coeruleofusca]|uniref:Uncharacterized protein n=1 Tax=Saccharothrix coeruleofusca TaxID=33919 RepID=A0A918AGA4_9PSEU|nr:hypothetical protein [Saccharothrix coeruleofusca]GGP33986.1 hypothetical protein GCM10010185_00460 [Saccharothrix coeruleofusca]